MALHAGLPVAVDRAVELVLAWLQRHGQPRGAAVADGLAVLVDAVALDRDRMRQGGGVLHDDRHPAGLRAQIGLVELQRPARVGGEAQGLAAARRGRGGGGLGPGPRPAGVGGGAEPAVVVAGAALPPLWVDALSLLLEPQPAANSA